MAKTNFDQLGLDEETKLASSNAAVTAVANVVVASGSEPTKAEYDTVVALVNDLKLKYNASVALINEIKVKLNSIFLKDAS